MRFPLASNRIRHGKVNHTFGMVRKDKNGRKKAHQGWDLQAPIGTDVFAVEAGTVEIAGNRGSNGLGLTVMQSFKGPGNTTMFAVYAHLQSMAVKAGDRVTEGQLIGKTGDSGNARNMTGEDLHLHFEFRTSLLPGTGLVGRVDPVTIFGGPPYRTAVAPTPVPTAVQQPRP